MSASSSSGALLARDERGDDDVDLLALLLEHLVGRACHSLDISFA